MPRDASCILFADDTIYLTLTAVRKSVREEETVLQSPIDNANTWFRRWKVKVNPTKTTKQVVEKWIVSTSVLIIIIYNKQTPIKSWD